MGAMSTLESKVCSLTTWESPQVENPLLVSCCCAEMRKCAIRDAVIKASAVMRCLFRDEDLRTPKCIVVDSHGTLMKGVDSTEQRTSRSNAGTCAATLLQRENLRKVDFFCARRLHRAVSYAAMEIAEIGSAGSCRGCTGDQFSSPHCRLSTASSNLVFP